MSCVLSVRQSDEDRWCRFVGTRLRGHMRESGLVNIEEKAAGVWLSGDLELKGVLCWKSRRVIALSTKSTDFNLIS